jgi:hypothetical protein
MNDSYLLDYKKRESVYGIKRILRITLFGVIALAIVLIANNEEHSWSKSVTSVNYITISIH